MAGILCTVATPTRELFSGEISYASVPGEDGSYGVLPGHEMLVSMNRKGLLSLWIDSDGKEKREFLVCDGVSQVYNDQLTVLARFGGDVAEANRDEIAEKAQNMKDTIERLKDSDDEQDKTECENSRQRLEWYEFELGYLGGQA